MAQTVDTIINRVRSLCVSTPFNFTEAQTPFSFSQQPNGEIDGCFRITDRNQRTIGGFNYSEVRIDQVQIWVARRFNGEPTATKRILTRDMHSITAAVMRDGLQHGGDYAVEDDGRTYEIRADDGAAYAVLQLVLPVNYESQL